MRERRRYVRTDGLVLVEYKGLQIKGKCSVFDISGVGIRITIDKELKLGYIVDLEIYLPGNSQPIFAKGEVVWVRSCQKRLGAQFKEKKQYFYTGIKFSDISAEKRTQIADYVYRKLR